jgi:hypothetical protein
MEPDKPWRTRTQIKRKGKADTDNVSGGQQGITFCPRGPALGYEGLGHVTPHGFRGPGLSIFNLKYSSRINDAHGRVDCGDVFTRLLTNRTEHKDCHRFHDTYILLRLTPVGVRSATSMLGNKPLTSASSVHPEVWGFWDDLLTLAGRGKRINGDLAGLELPLPADLGVFVIIPA